MKKRDEPRLAFGTVSGFIAHTPHYPNSTSVDKSSWILYPNYSSILGG